MFACKLTLRLSFRKMSRKRNVQATSAQNDTDESEPKITKRQGIVSNRDFFDVECIKLANALLGKILVRQSHGKLLKGRIVETECYLGGEDKASNSYNNRRTPANEPMYMTPGTSFVYMTYGMYYCMNISSKGDGAAVLLRSLEPLEGIEEMTELRTSKRKKVGIQLKKTELCNGPSKLCISLSIDKETCNKVDMCNSNKMWIEDDNFTDFKTVNSSRIGIDSAGKEWASKLLRFYIFSNPNVSKPDRKAESLLNK